VHFPALAIGTGAFKQGESTGISAAARAVIGARAGQKLAPAIFAQAVIGFTNASLTVDADRRPEKMIQTLQSKSAGSFYLYLIHADNYKPKYFYSKSNWLLSNGPNQPIAKSADLTP